MSRLIVTTSASGAGHLKQVARGARVLALQHRLVRDFVPLQDDPGTFFAARAAEFAADPAACGSWDPVMDTDAPAPFAEIAKQWRNYDEIEFWADPFPNAQLLLIQFLTWFEELGPAATDKLRLHQADTSLGERTVPDDRSLHPDLCFAEPDHFAVARDVWRAFRHSTPEHVAGLLTTDLSPLDWLLPSLRRLLDELPDRDTGLGATERQMLSLIASGRSQPRLVLHGVTREGEGAVLDYWEAGKALDRLCEGAMQAVLGLMERPFNLALHDDHARLTRYRTSHLSLSNTGTRLLGGETDVLERAHVDRWWGGTRLTNDTLRR